MVLLILMFLIILMIVCLGGVRLMSEFISNLVLMLRNRGCLLLSCC